ncbi:copper resistance determinant CrdA [Arcobacter sp. 15-2]|uniref:FixH family protein n=1 Tax=Arcobacter sp. 15-2 TaxID=3374109 RepID=UPI00399C91FB
MKKIIFMLMFFVGIVLNANVIEQNGEKNGYDLKLYTKTTPISGNNDFYVTLEKSGKVISNAKMKIKVFMPEMPGMPYMEYKAKAKLVDGEYKMMINFSMSGTWQYHLKFKTIDNKVHTVRGSVNI